MGLQILKRCLDKELTFRRCPGYVRRSVDHSVYEAYVMTVS